MKHSVKTSAAAAALGTVVIGSTLALPSQANPFGFEALATGYQLVGAEGKCGEGKCGETMKKVATDKAKEGKCGEGKCGEGMKQAIDKAKEGKCGEGKCGAGMKNTTDNIDKKVEALKKDELKKE
ncbi:MAG: HvfA family oxazolone/thioamide-modified RiPP metallophore [Shewanella sp.]